MDKWKGKVAVVTGASSGIGAATVIELVKAGLIVVGIARRIERVQALEAELADAQGKLYTKKVDVSKENEIIELFNWIKDSLGTVHVLVNNAGIMRYGSLTTQDPKCWRELFETNVIGLTICTQQALKLMKTTGVDDGYIINMNSILGYTVPVLNPPVLAMYPSTKHSITALTEVFRQELKSLKSKTRVTSISPGMVRTEIYDASTAAMGEDGQQLSDYYRKVFNLSTMVPKDVADIIVFVLSTPLHVHIHDIKVKSSAEL